MTQEEDRFQITDKEFQDISELMYSTTGVFLKPVKKALVVSRLRRRLLELRCGFKEYIVLLYKPHSSEMCNLINAITTNETFFFRHSKQFDFLRDTVLPELCEKKKDGRLVSVWSAACSTGEEPYSIAMILKEFFSVRYGWQWKVYASDINTNVLAQAKKALYGERSVKEVPIHFKKSYFKSVQVADGLRMQPMFELSPDIKNSVEFSQHNLLVPFGLRNLDIIFLRNAMIYFNKEAKQKVINLLEQNLARGGYFFISLSESLSDVTSGLTYIGSSIYKKEKK